jgi:hypothetical protein
MLKKLFILILVVSVLVYDWKTFPEIFVEGPGQEIAYLKLFGSVSFLSILLYFLDRENMR